MKKRKFRSVGAILKICTGSLMAMTVLTGQHSSMQPLDSEGVQVFILSPAATQGGAHQRDAIANPVWTRYELQAAAPPGMLKGPVCIVTLDLPQPAPPPTGLYALSILGLGAVGFLFGAPSATAQLAQRRAFSDKIHNEGSGL